MAKKKIMRVMSLSVCLVMGIIGAGGCGGSEEAEKEQGTSTKAAASDKDGKEEETKAVEMKDLKITVDKGKTYQTVESFGASGAWWSQAVGGWSESDDDGMEKREKIAQLLFDSEKGIGLTNYRYNIGAGTADSRENYSGITDSWRRAYSFLDENGEYDWSRDENAVWMLRRAKEMGVKDIVFFCNSPLVSLTKNGKGCGDSAAGGTTSNLPKENYRAFAEYVLDVVEHFKGEGYPIRYVSPVNEPQWEWTGGQEGCHYEPQELVDFLNVFLDVMEERKIEGLELSAPELGEWGNTSRKYLDAIYNDERLKSELKCLDIHSYWSDSAAKDSFLAWKKDRGLADVTLKMSEWCEMKNGKDYTMDSALELAKTIHTDLTKLNVTSWQYWIAVSCYDYRDGLIYVTNGRQYIYETKRLWAMGNYSRFIKEGYVRVDCTADAAGVSVSAYRGKTDDGKENTVIVLVNGRENGYNLSTQQFSSYTSGEVYVTDENHSLEKTGGISETSIEIPPMSVVTVTLY